MNIAIVRLSSLGDIIFCMASLQIIKRRFPESSITWVADRKFADILDHNPDLKEIVKLDLKGLKNGFSVGKLREEYGKIRDLGKFDIAIDLHGMIKSAFIARKIGQVATGCHRKVVKEPLAALMYDRRFDIPFEQHVVSRYVSLVAQSLGFSYVDTELTDKRPFLYYQKDDLQVSAGYFKSNRKNIIFIPETSLAYKNYPKEKFIELANNLGENILICYGNELERQTAEYMAERSPNVSILPRMNLNQLKAAISRADLVIGGDTGPIHMAWANNIPSITIFGATTQHCVHATATNIAIKSSSRANPRRPDKNDLSIREIEASLILRHAEELLQR